MAIALRTPQLVANPGCYATSVILALAPLLKAGVVDRERGIISDSKSGVSGAGKEPTARTHFVSVADNLSAYSVFNHRHVGEMVEQLELDDAGVDFHAAPAADSARNSFDDLRAPEPRDETGGSGILLPRISMRASAGCGFLRRRSCRRCSFRCTRTIAILGFCLAEDGRRLVLVSCVDNLLKGAAGQAVQNMNLMYGWNEEEGLQ